jgi:hypothetical protein
MYSALYPCQILMKLGYSTNIFEISKNVKLSQNPSNRSQHFTFGQTDVQADMTEVFRNFANACRKFPNKGEVRT